MQASHQQLRELLEKAGIRFTAQRLEMARILLEKDQHVTAEEVFSTVNRLFPHASRATVFNNLKLFADKGIVHMLELKSGVTLYDSNVKSHHHAFDSRTGEIVDLPLDPELEKRVKAELLKTYSAESGLDLENARLQITLRGKSKPS